MTEPQRAVSEIRAVLIPLQSGRLLLPNATVAEVVSYQAPEAAEGAPDWLMGEVEWRGEHLPLVSFERALGQDTGAPDPHARIVVCNTLNGNQRRPHIGILTTAIPRLIRVVEQGLEARPTGMDGEVPVLQTVSVHGEDAWIPDLDALERMLEDACGPEG